MNCYQSMISRDVPAQTTIALTNSLFVHEKKQLWCLTSLKFLSPANCSKTCFIAGNLHPKGNYRLKLNFMHFAACWLLHVHNYSTSNKIKGCTEVWLHRKWWKAHVILRRISFSYFYLCKHLKGTQSHHTSAHRWTYMSLCPKAIAVETISSAKFWGVRTSSLPTVCSLFVM